MFYYCALTIFGRLLIKVAQQGRMVEIYGKEASGKTTLALHVIKEAQKNGGLRVFYEGLIFSIPLLSLAIFLLTTKKKILFFVVCCTPEVFHFHFLVYLVVISSIFGDLSSLQLVHYIQSPDLMIFI